MTTEPTEKHKQEARALLRDWADAMPMVSWFDLDELTIRNLPHELNASDLIERVARSLSSRDTEIREVLEGLSRILHYKHGPAERCWCPDPNSNWTHTPACLATRALWEKIQPPS